jgi:hypothetical protein
MARKTYSLLFAPPCQVCGKHAVRLEIVPPGGLPQEWDNWKPADRQIYSKHRNATKYVHILEGVECGNGLGNPISEQEARDIVGMLSPKFDLEAVHRRFYDDLGYCAECREFYCSTHWSPSRGGYSHCPNGHGKSLDPHWSPEDYD